MLNCTSVEALKWGYFWAHRIDSAEGLYIDKTDVEAEKKNSESVHVAAYDVHHN